MVYRLVPLSFFLFFSGCLGMPRSPIPGSYRPIDPATGQEIVNALTIGADWTMYAGILFVIGGILAVIFLKAIKTGGLSVITGVCCLITAQFLNYMAAHIGLLIGLCVTVIVLSGFLYWKAITVGLPWLEKLFDFDFNGDGNIGTLAIPRHNDEVPKPQDDPLVRDNTALEKPEG